MSYTRLGCHLWSWEPFATLPTSNAKLLWLALYTSAEAKRCVPGLFHGSVHAMADAARMQADDVVTALDTLLEYELVEYDRKLRVLRLTELPDAGESPANGKVLRSWFTKWRSVPACAVRDAHVATIRWLMDTWSKETGKPLSPDHEKAWAETFAVVKIPAPRRRGVRRLLENAQPGLFDERPEPPSPSSPSPSSGGPDTVPNTEGRTTEGGFVSNLTNPENLNDLDMGFTVSDTVSLRYGSGPGSGPGVGSSSSPESGAARADLPGDLERDQQAARQGPKLTLVPMPVDQQRLDHCIRMLGVIAVSAGRNPRVFAQVTQAQQAALCARIATLEGSLVSEREYALVGHAIARGEASIVVPITGTRETALCEWVLEPGAFEATLAKAIEHHNRQEQIRAERMSALEEARTNLGYQPPPQEP